MSDSTCRLCLKDIDPDDCGSSVYDEHMRLAMANVFPFEISFHRDLPMNTCKHCTWNVMDFDSYCENVQKNQKKLEQELIVDDDSESDEDDLPMGNNYSDEVISEEIIPSACDVSSLVKPEHFADCNIELSPVDISAVIFDDAVDELKENITVAYEPHPDFASVDWEEACKNELQLNVARKEDQTVYCSEPEHLIQSEENNTDHSINAHIHNITVLNGKASESEHHHTGHGVNETLFCDQCCKTFSSKLSLYKHKRYHVSVECPICKQSKSINHIRPHLAAHQGAFCCDACDKQLSCVKAVSVDEQRRCTLVKANGTVYGCDQCSKSFPSKKKLRDHMRVHVSEECPVCKKRLMKANVRRHAARHNVCEKSYD
uniref:C2H2-type domain-containing protein n=1 Tax=Anopheles farauti TaxID=69004 RepID=A0A182Q6W0_9DIPT